MRLECWPSKVIHMLDMCLEELCSASFPPADSDQMPKLGLTVSAKSDLDLHFEENWIPTSTWSTSWITYDKDHWNGCDRTLTVSRDRVLYPSPKLFAIEFSSTFGENLLDPFTIYVWRLWHDTDCHFLFSIIPGTRFEIDTANNVSGEESIDILLQKLDAMKDRVIINLNGEKHEIFITLNVKDVLQHKIFTITIDTSPYSG
jgi:hypothetical protein